MSFSFSSEAKLLTRKAERAALQLVRRFGLPEADHDDIRQNFLVELFVKTRRFDPDLGTVDGFAAVIIKHAASSLAAQIHRERALFDRRSLDEPLNSDGIPVGHTFSEDEGYLAKFSSQESCFAKLDRKLALRRALETLSPENKEFLERLMTHSVSILSEASVQSRAGLYRRLQEIRLCLLAAGLGPNG